MYVMHGSNLQSYSELVRTIAILSDNDSAAEVLWYSDALQNHAE